MGRRNAVDLPLSYLDVLQREEKLMADRVAWDAKVRRVVETTRQRTVRPPRKTRKGMQARGTGPSLAGCDACARRTRTNGGGFPSKKRNVKTCRLRLLSPAASADDTHYKSRWYSSKQVEATARSRSRSGHLRTAHTKGGQPTNPTEAEPQRRAGEGKEHRGARPRQPAREKRKCAESSGDSSGSSDTTADVNDQYAG
ncbi:hypothetical protein DIPPA_11312 [Diplonema papillatum]|nr:hypothetical protein DIPPA_11312 [Diplonema papillatum]